VHKIYPKLKSNPCSPKIQKTTKFSWSPAFKRAHTHLKHPTIYPAKFQKLSIFASNRGSSTPEIVFRKGNNNFLRESGIHTQPGVIWPSCEVNYRFYERQSAKTETVRIPHFHAPFILDFLLGLGFGLVF
jgi:hypothetical protein